MIRYVHTHVYVQYIRTYMFVHTYTHEHANILHTYCTYTFVLYCVHTRMYVCTIFVCVCTLSTYEHMIVQIRMYVCTVHEDTVLVNCTIQNCMLVYMHVLCVYSSRLFELILNCNW